MKTTLAKTEPLTRYWECNVTLDNDWVECRVRGDTLEEVGVQAERIARALNSHQALVEALKAACGALAWHESRHGVAMDAEYVKRARAALALAEGGTK